MPDNTLTRRGIAVGIDEAADLGIIVAAVEIVEAGFSIVVVTTVADGIDLGDGTGGSQDLAVRVIHIAACQRTAGIQDHHHIALQVGEEIVHRAVVLHGVGGTVVGIEEIQNVSGLIGTVVPDLPQQLAAGIGIDAGDVARGLAGSHAACIVGEADIGSAIRCGSQAPAVAPAHSPSGAVVIADRIAGGVIGDRFRIIKLYHTITCFTMHMAEKSPRNQRIPGVGLINTDGFQITFNNILFSSITICIFTCRFFKTINIVLF